MIYVSSAATPNMILLNQAFLKDQKHNSKLNMLLTMGMLQNLFKTMEQFPMPSMSLETEHRIADEQAVV